MDLSEINRAKVLVRWDRVHAKESEYLRLNLEKNQHLKARIHGYLCGDGSVSARKEHSNGKIHYELHFYPDHKSMVSAFSDAFQKVYGKTPSVCPSKNYFRMRVTSTVIVKDLMKDGSFRSLEWDVPDWVRKDTKNSVEWLRAFFDAEAYVGPSRICVQSVNHRGLMQVKQMLEKFGIESRYYVYHRKNKNWNTNHHIVIYKRESRRIFLKRIGLNHTKKLLKLRNADVA